MIFFLSTRYKTAFGFAMIYTLGNAMMIAAQEQPVREEKPASVDTQSIETVAGKRIKQYAVEFHSEHRTIRLRAIKSMIAFGEQAADHLVSALQHDDPAMRYVACVGLGDLAGQNLEIADTLEVLQRLADDDPSAAVQMAAAYAVCQSGNLELGLPILMKRMEHPERGVVCSAAELIGKLGPEAGPAIPALEKVIRNNNRDKKVGDAHKRGAAMNALRKVRGDG